MKKIAAFLIALVMAGATIWGMPVYSSGKMGFHSPDFGYWTAEQKFQSPEVIKSNLNENSLVIMASSELEHGKGTPYHPQKMFKGNIFQPMLIRAGGLCLCVCKSAIMAFFCFIEGIIRYFRQSGIII